MKYRTKSNYKILAQIFALLICATTIFNYPEISNAKEKIPKYEGAASIQLNKNVPSFSKKEITTDSYEKYGTLDKLGRCTTAEACIGLDLMPTEKRGPIGMIKPTGWKQNKYPGLVDSEPPYLYNRCHMIGYQLSGENANEKNLITGTRYFNIEGMLSYEDLVADYVKNTGNHVMYRVTPYFENNNLLCNGVQIEALSVEDNGKGISFNVFCFNVQPGVLIDYSDGSNTIDKNYVKADNSINAPSAPSVAVTSYTYIGNKKSKKFHYPTCSSVGSMNESNKLYFEGSRNELIEMGYVPCQRCHP